jgi:signal transduction histidine kinase
MTKMKWRAMIGPKKILVQPAGLDEPPRYVQFWVIAMVFSLFSALFFIMAMMDVRRLEGMLLDHRIKRAQYVLEGIQKGSEDWFDYLTSVFKPDESSPGHPLPREAFSSQGALAKPLAELARRIRSREQMQMLSRESLQSVTDSEDLAAILLLDEAGQVLVQTGPVSEGILSRARIFVDGHEEVAVHLPQPIDNGSPSGFVGMRGQEGKGAIILVLDAKSRRSWMIKTAVHEAVEKSLWIKAVTYLIIEDAAGHPITRAGYTPDGALQYDSPAPVISGDSTGSASPRTEATDMQSVEITLPFMLHGEMIGKARVGVSRGADRLVVQDRQHIFLWTGIMILIGLFAMGLLYHTQNRHIARLHAMRERLHQAERISSLAKLAAGVAHEIRNPLNAVSMAAQRLQREFSPPAGEEKAEFQRITHIIRDEVRRLDGIVEDFLGLSRTDRLHLHAQPITDLLRRIGFLVREEAEALGIRLVEERSDYSPSILMDAGKMEQALLNIVRNAMESISGKGCIAIGVEKSGRNRAGIKVRDSGTGIPPEEACRVFDPFYTTKENGVGLGLCIAHEIVVAHGGEIRIHSEPGVGTTFEILLPEAAE